MPLTLTPAQQALVQAATQGYQNSAQSGLPSAVQQVAAGQLQNVSTSQSNNAAQVQALADAANTAATDQDNSLIGGIQDTAAAAAAASNTSAAALAAQAQQNAAQTGAQYGSNEAALAAADSSAANQQQGAFLQSYLKEHPTASPSEVAAAAQKNAAAMASALSGGSTGSYTSDPAGTSGNTQYNPSGGGMGSNAPREWVPETNLSNSRNEALETAFSYTGDPYQLGGTSHAGIDCSGLVMAVYDQFGLGQYINNHNATTQAQQIPGVRTAVSNLQPGDIVAWKDGSHIAIYAGNNMIVAAAAPGEGVKYQPVWGDVYGIHLTLPGE